MSGKTVTLSTSITHRGPASHVTCADGTTLSVQASDGHYSTPRNLTGPYSEVEVWCLDFPENLPDTARGYPEWYEDNGPAGYVPIDKVAAFIDEHGGFRV